MDCLKANVSLRRAICVREYNIRMDHKELGCEDVAWRIRVAQDRDQLQGLVNMIMNFQVP
jgi:hypothetical protein